jgi:hypothetical protein
MLHSIRGGKSPQRSDAKDASKFAHISTNDTADDLTNALADTERMASILTTLLEERLVDTGKGPTLSIRRQDGSDIRFAAEQLRTMLARAGEIWRAIP